MELTSHAEVGRCLGPGISVFSPLSARLVLIDDLLDDVLRGRVSPEPCPPNDVIPATLSQVRSGQVRLDLTALLPAVV